MDERGERFWRGFIHGAWKIKWPEPKNLLAMTIDSDNSSSGGEQRRRVARKDKPQL